MVPACGLWRFDAYGTVQIAERNAGSYQRTDDGSGVVAHVQDVGALFTRFQLKGQKSGSVLVGTMMLFRFYNVPLHKAE